MRAFVVALIYPLLLGGLAAQTRDVPPPPPEEKVDERKTDADNADVRTVESGQAPESQPDGGLKRHCSAIVMTQPSKVQPGMAGSLFVVVAMQNQAVILGGTGIEVTYEAEQGDLRLGEWRARPAKPGKLYPRFSGQQIHEDTLTLEIPLTIDAAAKVGPQMVDLEISTELHDGRDGKLLAQGELPVRGKIEIGRPIGTAVLSQATGSGSRGSVTTAHVAGEETSEFALFASETVVVDAAGSATFGLRLAIPEGLYITKDDDLRVPRIALEDAGDGLRIELGPEPAAATKEVAGMDPLAVYSGEYSRQVTLHADESARQGSREATLKVYYAACEESGVCHAPTAIAMSMTIEVQPQDGPSGQVGTPNDPLDEEEDEEVDPFDADVAGAESSDDLMLYLLAGGGGSLLILLIVLLISRRK